MKARIVDGNMSERMRAAMLRWFKDMDTKTYETVVMRRMKQKCREFSVRYQA